MHGLYLILDLAVLSVPLAFSFDRKVAYYKSWRFLFPAIILNAVIFLAWDVWFTDRGIWGFNEDYLIGISAFGLPLEEWLFFIVVPYACIFIYESLKTYIPKDFSGRFSTWIHVALLLLVIPLIILNSERDYTFFASAFAMFLLVYHLIVRKKWTDFFWLAFAISMIPFLIVNGILTGTGIESPVVWYNDAQNLGIRIGTIPVEDTIYAMSLLLLPVTLFEYFRNRALPR